MSRISATFAALQARGERAFIPYITAGDPSLSFTLELVVDMARNGADIIELGVPYSDPIADGPINQEAAARALQAGTRLPHLFELVQAARQRTDVPILFFTYCNPVIQYGMERFFKQLAESGGDGIIMPDLPIEESEPFRETADRFGIDVVSLVAPTSQERIARICRQARGFVYAVSSLGVTGLRTSFDNRLPQFIEQIKANTTVPVAVGFGISGPDQARTIANYADGAVVGSAIVRRIGEIAALIQAGDEHGAQEKREQLLAFVRSVKQALCQ